MFISKHDIASRPHDEHLSLLFAAYETFINKMSDSEQSAFLALRSSNFSASELRKVAAAVVVHNKDNQFSRLMNYDEIGVFVKISSIVRMNVFAVHDGFVVFDSQPLTRMSHSCTPNCSIEIVNHVCTCRIIQHTSVGDTLTYEYSARTRSLPTHLRRQYYLEKKSFTCHCPRCSSPHDDTRQFKCFDLNCTGSHYVCQPLNQNEMLCPEAGYYTRVHYMPPHLLPCTVCQRFPPAFYESSMLSREEWLPSAVAEISLLGQQVLHGGDYALAPTVLLKVAHTIMFNPQHVLSFEVLRVGYQMWMVHVFVSGDAYLPKFYRAVDNFVLAFQQHTLFPSDQGVNVLVGLVRDLMQIPTKVSVLKAHSCCAWALRMHLVLHGRDSYHRSEIDRLMGWILDKMGTAQPTTAGAVAVIQGNVTPLLTSSDATPTSASFTTSSSEEVRRGTPPTLVCTFCGECAALALCKNKRCAQCKVASYCSIGCQKAHWKVHKNVCQAADK